MKVNPGLKNVYKELQMITQGEKGDLRKLVRVFKRNSGRVTGVLSLAHTVDYISPDEMYQAIIKNRRPEGITFEAFDRRLETLSNNTEGTLA